MNENNILLLERYGWIIECESPIEIRYKETSNFVTGIAAEDVLYDLKSEEKIKVKCCAFDVGHSVFSISGEQLSELIERIDSKITKMLDKEGKSTKGLALSNSVSDTIRSYFKINKIKK